MSTLALIERFSIASLVIFRALRREYYQILDANVHYQLGS